MSPEGGEIMVWFRRDLTGVGDGLSAHFCGRTELVLWDVGSAGNVGLPTCGRLTSTWQARLSRAQIEVADRKLG